ncbi:hypothetical protein C8J57DRAFT_1229605 [Mycena rebaudengoi]|nr:hypothetical protein C8J57DRAFT_1229605 [Mycena rebaudengoi]
MQISLVRTGVSVEAKRLAHIVNMVEAPHTAKWRYAVIFQILSHLVRYDESSAVAVVEANILNSVEKLLRSRLTDLYEHIFSMLESLASHESIATAVLDMRLYDLLLTLWRRDGTESMGTANPLEDIRKGLQSLKLYIQSSMYELLLLDRDQYGGTASVAGRYHHTIEFTSQVHLKLGLPLIFSSTGMKNDTVLEYTITVRMWNTGELKDTLKIPACLALINMHKDVVSNFLPNGQGLSSESLGERNLTKKKKKGPALTLRAKANACTKHMRSTHVFRMCPFDEQSKDKAKTKGRQNFPAPGKICPPFVHMQTTCIERMWFPHALAFAHGPHFIPRVAPPGCLNLAIVRGLGKDDTGDA